MTVSESLCRLDDGFDDDASCRAGGIVRERLDERGGFGRSVTRFVSRRLVNFGDGASGRVVLFFFVKAFDIFCNG